MLISVVKSGTNAVKCWLYVGNFFDWYFPGAGSDTLINWTMNLNRNLTGQLLDTCTIYSTGPDNTERQIVFVFIALFRVSEKACKRQPISPFWFVPNYGVLKIDSAKTGMVTYTFYFSFLFFISHRTCLKSFIKFSALDFLSSTKLLQRCSFSDFSAYIKTVIFVM